MLKSDLNQVLSCTFLTNRSTNNSEILYKVTFQISHLSLMQLKIGWYDYKFYKKLFAQFRFIIDVFDGWTRDGF